MTDDHMVFENDEIIIEMFYDPQLSNKARFDIDIKTHDKSTIKSTYYVKRKK